MRLPRKTCAAVLGVMGAVVISAPLVAQVSDSLLPRPEQQKVNDKDVQILNVAKNYGPTGNHSQILLGTNPTAEQLAAFGKILSEESKQFRTILAEEQAQLPTSWPRQRLTGLFAKNADAIYALLTPSQQAVVATRFAQIKEQYRHQEGQPAGNARAQVTALRRPLSGTPVKVTAFVDVAVIPMDTERVLAGQTVLVEGGRITALGPSRTIKVPAGAVRIDGRGQYLIPGLADMHAHVDIGSPDGMERALLELLTRGVTTIRNVTPHNASASEALLRLRARVVAGELLSPRIYTAGSLWGGAYTPDDMKRLKPEEIAGRVAAYQAAGYDFIKPYWETAEVFDSVAAAARRLGLPLMGHVPFDVKLERVFAVGMRSIEHLEGYIRTIPGTAETQPVDTAQFAALAAATRRAGVWNTPTLAMEEGGYENARRDSTTLREWEADMFVRRRLVKALQDAGAGLLLGTDLFAHQNPVHKELEAFVRAGLTPYQALATGTRNVAAFFGTLDSTGTITIGKRADLVLLRGNPLQDIKHTADLSGVMIGGQWLSHEGAGRRVGTPVRAAP